MPSDALLTRLRAKIAEWRERARCNGAIYASGIEECADDLDALLSVPSTPRAPDDQELADSLRYARGLLGKAARNGAAFVDINVSTLAYLCEDRRRLNDRVRWAERRAAAPSTPPAPVI